MDAFQSNDILHKRDIAERQQFIWILSGFFVLNSVLTWVFFTARPHENLRLFCYATAAAGIAACVIAVIVLWATATATIKLSDALVKIEQDPCFNYMKEKNARPFTDIGIAIPREWKKPFHALAFLPLGGMALWILLLVTSFN